MTTNKQNIKRPEYWTARIQNSSTIALSNSGHQYTKYKQKVCFCHWKFTWKVRTGNKFLDTDAQIMKTLQQQKPLNTLLLITSFSSSSIWKLSKSPLVLLGSSPTLYCSKLFWSRSSLLVEKTHSRIEHKIICFQHFVSFLPKRKVSNVAFPAFDRESVYTIVYSL